jgi:hypothetical protein
MKDQQKRLVVANVKVTNPNGKGKDRLVAKRIDITPMPKVLDKVMIQKDVKKEPKLLDSATMDEDLHVADNESNQDSMVPSNQRDVDQEEAEEYHNLSSKPTINKLLQEDAKDGIIVITHLAS